MISEQEPTLMISEQEPTLMISEGVRVRQSNSVSDAGAAALATALSCVGSPTLKTLDLGNNEAVSGESEAAFGRLIYTHPDLKLGLVDTSVPPDCIEKILLWSTRDANGERQRQ
eukprot:6520-Rhodomonas_salina.1